MIKWHVPSQKSRHLTNFSIGYINGNEAYEIIYTRESRKDYRLYRRGVHLSTHLNITQAIAAAENIESKLKRNNNDKTNIPFV